MGWGGGGTRRKEKKRWNFMATQTHTEVSRGVTSYSKSAGKQEGKHAYSIFHSIPHAFHKNSIDSMFQESYTHVFQEY